MATKKTTTKTTASPAATTASTEADHDRIVMASRAPDGTPAQVDPEFIGPVDVVEEAASVQLTQQKVSAIDQAERGVPARDQTSEPDPAVAKLVREHGSAEEAAKRQAKSEVASLHKGQGE